MCGETVAVRVYVTLKQKYSGYINLKGSGLSVFLTQFTNLATFEHTFLLVDSLRSRFPPMLLLRQTIHGT